MKRSLIMFTISLMVSVLFSISTEAKPKPKKVYDAIIVPGYPFNPDRKMNAIYQMRLHWAYELYTSGRTTYIIVSGGAVHSPYVESEIFALYLKEMGVKPEHIITESQAEHSLENVYYSAEIAKQRGFNSVAVATDLFQSGMIQILGAKHEIEMEYVPAKIGFIITKKWNSFKGTIDYQQAFVENFVPLKERETKEERLNGTHGYNVYAKN